MIFLLILENGVFNELDIDVSAELF